MENYFHAEDKIRKAISNIKKKANYSETTKKNFTKLLLTLKNELKTVILNNDKLRSNNAIIARYNYIKEQINEAYSRMSNPALDESKVANVEEEDKSENTASENTQDSEIADIKEQSDTSDSDSDLENEQENMATVLEIIKTTSTLVPEFDGDSEKLNRVISAIKALEPLINAQNKATAIQVILSKLSGKARSAVGDNPQELNTIIDRLKARCSATQSPEVILAKLSNEKQTGELSKFTDQVERLTLQLENAYIAENVPLATATRLATKAGTNALASGVRNRETQLIIKAGKFDTLADAIGKANENERNLPTSSVLYYRAPFNNQGPPRGHRGHRGRGARGNNSRGRNAYHGRQYDNQNNYRPNQENSWRGRNFNHPPQRNQWSGRQMFFANQNQGNGTAPQPQQPPQGGGGNPPNQQALQLSQTNQPIQLAQMLQRQ